MHVKNRLRAPRFMQAVDVLSHDGYSASSPRGPILLQSGKRSVRRVGLNIARYQLPPTGIVEIVHPGRVLREGLRSGHILEAYLRPNPVTIPKCVKAGLLGDAGACQNDDLLVVRNCHDKEG